MLTITTTTPDAIGFGSFEELSAGVFLDPYTWEVIVTDGRDNALLISGLPGGEDVEGRLNLAIKSAALKNVSVFDN